MTTAIHTFFSAWAMSDDTERGAAIHAALAEDARYADPRSSGVLTGPDEIGAYVAAFSANAPGWSARVVASSATADMVRATVAFGGTGPDGSDMVQHGQYFVRVDDAGRIDEMVGFAGMGAPE
ncbi:nuclear transport factor 2 family protein [Ponticoccus sp. SC2-23]|uniref:nuclear transport factor 2 family protein n=1 Tax=Alexandriicola marinus TaxID=2081710 RepID=UPI000FD913FC|nr:nuclear transport factor 2 family protein [Alexandriicola marinus]MBM1220154.1 nuclear transport factor 2 family protein [Ponticoccus sp. SC6-9]MBM1224840.1 nuclear transport factor 2 family protein [Ponticoccus sp. SC6-15]MBM1228354.1 nuclear transport factor 2 family protein [Ponticoccus sp. SC6-38]MBM1234009.1 nuclear transport factor 2 family protein [Ponticoccus sp. SC6-45]MBM1238855.1 nuclear transport factor 2 family protein [Ponticoccus sp. SC6-49]MBM1242637.1 nuclear transport fac